PGRRPVALWLTGFGAALAAFFVPPLLLQDWQAVWGAFQFQLSRPPLGPTIYGTLLPQALEGERWYAQAFRLGCVLLTALGLALTRPPDLAALLGRAAIIVIVFISVPIFYSPQWILWLSPLLLPLAARHRAVWLLVVALDLVTYFTFPHRGLLSEDLM